MTNSWTRWRTRLAVVAAVAGPGLIAGAGGNDAGGIWTYSVAGARFGFTTGCQMANFVGLAAARRAVELARGAA